MDSHSVHTARTVRNPFVIIIGIVDYESPFESLPAVKKDVEQMKYLWRITYKYQHVSCANDEIGDYMTKSQLMEFINSQLQFVEININKLRIDGLIFVYSGHGGTDSYGNNGIDIICSDKYGIFLEHDLQKAIWSNCKSLRDKPKIFYMDCCRGLSQIDQNDQLHIKSPQTDSKFELFDSIPKGSGGSNPFTDYYVHFATPKNYSAYTNEQNTMSWFISAIYDHYVQNVTEQLSLLQSGVAINGKLRDESDAKQTPEAVNRLTFDVYLAANGSQFLWKMRGIFTTRNITIGAIVALGAYLIIQKIGRINQDNEPSIQLNPRNESDLEAKQKQVIRPTPKLDLIKTVILAASGGMTEAIIGHPLDTSMYLFKSCQ